MDVNSGQGHQSPPEEIPSSESLGLQHPLLPPPALGQNFLQPHTLSPLGTVSLISLDTPLPTETAWANSLDTHISTQAPGETIDLSSSSHPHISRSFEPQLPETQPGAIAPKAPAEVLQPKLDQSSSHQPQPTAQNNTDQILRDIADTAEQFPSIETGVILQADPTRAASSSIQPAQHQVSTQSSLPPSEQTESEKQISLDQSSPDETLQPILAQASEFSLPAIESHPLESPPSSVSSQQEQPPGLQTASQASNQSVTESPQNPEQTIHKPSPHPSPNAVSPEVSAPSNPTDVPPRQAKRQDSPEIKATSEPSSIQKSLSKSPEQATPSQSQVKPSSPESTSLTNPKNSDSSPTLDSVSTHMQPSLQKASAANGPSLDPTSQIAQVVQSKEEPVSKATPFSSQKSVISAKPSQEQQVTNAQSTESQSVLIQTSLESAAQNNEDVATEATDRRTDRPTSQAIKPSTVSQTSTPQSTLTNPKEEANPGSSIDNGSSIATPAPSSPTETSESPIETTTVKRVAQSSSQLLPDDEPVLPESSETANSIAKTNESPTQTTVIQKVESSTANQTPTHHPHTPKDKANPTRPANESPSVENSTSTSKKADGEAIQATTSQGADDQSPQQYTQASTEKQQKQNKKSKRKKIPFQAQLSQMGERAKQDMGKVGIQLKQASHSLPVGKPKAKAQGLQKSTSGSPQPSNAPSIPAQSSPDSKQSSSEVSLVQRETKSVEQTPAQEPSRDKLQPENAKIANQADNVPTAPTIPESIDSLQEHPHSPPIQTKTSDPTIHQDQPSESVTGSQGITKSISNSKAIEPHRNTSESSPPEVSADQLKPTSSPNVTSTAESSSAQSEAKKQGQFPAQPLQRLTHFSKQVMDTVSRQLEPHPHEASISPQIQKQFSSKNSEQNRKDQTISPTSSHTSAGEDTKPSQSSGDEEGDNTAITSVQSDIQAKPFSPNTTSDTAIHSNSTLSSIEQEHPNSQSPHPTDATADKTLQTQELPTVQKSETSQSSISTPDQPQTVDFPAPSSHEASSPRKGHSPGIESQLNADQPGWQSFPNQLSDRITTLGSQIKERVDRSILKQSSRRTSSQPTKVKKANTVEPAISSEVTQQNAPLQSTDVPELNEDNIQTSVEPSSDQVHQTEQPLLTDSVQLTYTSNAAIENLVQTDVNSVVLSSQAEENHKPQELTSDPSIQSGSIEHAKTPQPPQDTGQIDPALSIGNEDSIQRVPDSSEITSASSDQPINDVSSQDSENLTTDIPGSSQSRNLPFNAHISNLGATLVQQLANLRPKKTKSKRKPKKQKPVSPSAKISSENSDADTTINPSSRTEQEKTSQSTDQPNVSESPTLPTPSSPTTETAAVLQHDMGEGREAALVQDPTVSDQLSIGKLPAIDSSSLQTESSGSEILSSTADSSVELNLSTAEIIQSQPINPEGTYSQPSDVERFSALDNPNLQQQTELSSLPSSDTAQLSPQKDSLAQGGATDSVPSIKDSIQRQDNPIQQSSQLDKSDDSINQSNASISPSSVSLPQAELSLQKSENSHDDPDISDTSHPPINPDTLLQRQTIQEQSQPDLPDSQTQNSLTQNVLETESPPPERPPINEISIQTKVEQPSVTHQSQQQLPTSPNLSVQQLSEKQEQVSSKSQKSNGQETSKVDVEVNAPKTASQNLGSPSTQVSQVQERDYNIPNGTSPTIQAQKHSLEEAESKQSLSASDTHVTTPNSDNTAIASTQHPQDLESQELNAPQAPNNSGDVSSKVTDTGRIVQGKLETHLDSSQPLVAPNEDVRSASEPLNVQPITSETPVLEESSAQTESNIESSNLASKPASIVPIQAVEISVVQPTTEPQPQKDNIGQSFGDCDRTPESAPNIGDNFSIQPTPLPQPIEQSEGQQVALNSDSETASAADAYLLHNLPEATIEPVIQASSIEQSPDPNSSPTDISETSEIIQSEHQSIQSQLDEVDFPNRRIIEIAAQRPNGNIANDNLPNQNLLPNSSSDLNEHQIIQKSLESDSSLVETDLTPANPEISSKVGEEPEVAERPQLKSDSKIQTSYADSSDSSLASPQPLSSPTIQRQDPSGSTLDSLEIDPINAQPDSTDSLQRRVIEIAAQPPESKLPEGNSPDLTVAQLLAAGQSPDLLSDIADTFVSPKLISSLLPSSKSNRKHHSQSNFQSPNIPLQLKTSSDETAESEDSFEVSMDDAIAPTIPPSSSPALPSNWSSIEDLFTPQPSVIQPKAESPTAAPEDTSGLVLTPTGIHPEKRVQRKTVSAQRTAQPLQKQPPTTLPPVSSMPQTTEVVMRQSQTKKSTESEVNEQSFEILAREIYHILRQRLEVERERHGGYQSGRLPW